MEYGKMIIDFFKNYGWQLGLLSLSGIVLLGALKWFGCFKKLPTKAKKYIYYTLSCVFSITACTIYILVLHTFNWLDWGVLSGSVILLTGGVYSIWEHSHLRDLWKKYILDSISKLLKWIVSAIANGSLSKEKLEAKALALGSEALSNLVAQAREIELKIAEQEKLKQAKGEEKKKEIDIKV